MPPANLTCRDHTIDTPHSMGSVHRLGDVLAELMDRYRLDESRGPVTENPAGTPFPAGAVNECAAAAMVS